MKSLIIIFIITLSASVSENTINLSIRNDASLIAPGIGAERILLNQSADDIMALKGYPDKISELKEKKELFSDVFKIQAPVKIVFDKIYYYNFQKAIFFLNSNNVCAIAGLNNQRITVDSVDLSRGIEFFIFNYGNKNLQIIKRDNDSKDIIYFYSKGIAVVDDKSDDKIDMYIVFIEEGKDY
ncbi:MAG: hypothetical protein JXN64_06645 [Spirochaetes bacterium]|nr:hypothetical protein [Spirochaetota bacterium]